MDDDTAPPTLDEIKEAFRCMEQFGLIRRTGEFQDGQPVYRAVKFDNPVNFEVSRKPQ